MTQTQTLARMKKPFGTAKMVDLTAVRYLAWEDAFEVDFEDGLAFLEPHSTIRKQNKISPKAEVERVELEDWCQSGFFVHYRQRPDRRSSVVVHPRIAAAKTEIIYALHAFAKKSRRRCI